jgi:hypothetical protein
MNLSNDDLEQLAAADRRGVDPPVRVEAATSRAGQLDWWVRDRQEWLVGYAVQTANSGGSELLIFVPGAAQSHDSSMSFVPGRRPCLGFGNDHWCCSGSRWGERRTSRYSREVAIPTAAARRRRRLLSLALAAVAIGLVVLEPFPKGEVLLSLTDTHGVDTGDIPALATLLVAAYLVIRS